VRNNNRNREDFFSCPWPWAYFLNGPNAAASVAPAFIRHWTYLDEYGGRPSRRLCVGAPACGFVYRSERSSNGTFTSPNFPGFYPCNTECHYPTHQGQHRVSLPVSRSIQRARPREIPVLRRRRHLARVRTSVVVKTVRKTPDQG